MSGKSKKICCILNYAPHYRKGIFLQMEKDLNCDFYFGEKTKVEIKKMDYALFHKSIRELKYKSIFDFHLLRGSVRMCFKSYNSFILTGEPSNLSSWFIAIICKVLNMKIYFWAHGTYINEKRLKRNLIRIYFKLADGIFLYGNYTKESMMKDGFDPKKLYLIYNSLDYNHQLSIRERLHSTNTYSNYFGNNNPVLVFIGRIDVQKKLHYLLDVQKKLIEEGLKINATFIGNGEDIDRLKALAVDLGIENSIWFYGECYEEDKIADLLYNAQLCISPGNVGLTAIHSLTFGTPVITHNNFQNQGPEFEAIIPGITGDFFNENSTDSLFSSIDRWLKRYPKKTNQIQNNCYSIVDEKYNPNYQCKVFKEVLLNNE